MKLVRLLMAIITLCVLSQSMDCKQPNETRVKRMDLNNLLRQRDGGKFGTCRKMDENPDRRKRSARSIHFTDELMKSRTKRQTSQVSNSDGQSQSHFSIIINKIRDFAKEMADLIQRHVTDMMSKMRFGSGAGSRAEAGTESFQ